MEPNPDPTTNLTRLTVAQAAKVLGLSAEAVRMRVKRNTLAHVKEDNAVYVLLDPSKLETDPTQSNGERTQPNADQTDDLTEDKDALVEALQDEVAFLREELRRANERREEEARRRDTIILSLTQRIPELEPAREAPPEPRDGRETATEEPGGVEVGEEQEKRSWWRRLFEG